MKETLRPLRDLASLEGHVWVIPDPAMRNASVCERGYFELHRKRERERARQVEAEEETLP